jgi:LPS-assembly protein
MNRLAGSPTRLCTAALLLLLAFFARAAGAAAAPRPQQSSSSPQGLVTLEADSQHKTGNVYYADGNVDIVNGTMRLRADHATYDDGTNVVTATGHVLFDYDTQHLVGDSGTYNLQTGKGAFRHVRGTITLERKPNPTLLISDNPISFAAAEVDRTNEETYVLHHAWVTVCDPGKPLWQFYARRATVHLEKTVVFENGVFHLLRVPVLYLPYATAPAGKRVRQTGFLTPDVGDSSTKGFILGDAFYWAPTTWFDSTVGGAWLSKRGYQQNEGFRMRPWENVTFDAQYDDVKDSGLPGAGPDGTRGPSQGGHDYHIGLDALLPDGWRAVADLNELSSLTYRLAFSETFNQAVNSEVHNTAFLQNNFHGFSVDFAGTSYQDFQSVSPQTYVYVRTAPEARIGSVEQAPWASWPVYFSFDAFADAVHRNDTVSGFSTPSAVSRLELAPTVTIPLHWHNWLHITPAFTERTTRYGGQLEDNVYASDPFVRTTEEFSLDIRPPSLERNWTDGDTIWKHTIEPEITYNYVNGVDDFQRIIRYDEDDTLTDTNDIEYSIVQRLFRRISSGDAEDLVILTVKQDYYLDPTFGGALVPGQRNVFQVLDSFTPFAFAEAANHFSPVVADLQVTPGGIYDSEIIADYDPNRGQLTALGALFKLKPYGESYFTLADFSTIDIPDSLLPTRLSVPPRSNQVRALFGYGDINRPGFNTAIGFSYDVTQQIFQNQVFEISYNGSCCGIGFEYRRFSLANVRDENQYRLVFLIANIGSAGNLRRQEKLF